MQWSEAWTRLTTAAALLLPLLAAADSQMQAGAAGKKFSATAHVDFKIIIPQVLSLDVAGGMARAPGVQLVTISTNSHNVTLAGTTRASVGSSLMLSAAARKSIAQDALCSVGTAYSPPAFAAAGRSAAVAAHRMVCTVATP